METNLTSSDLRKTRQRVAAKVRELRLARGWTQAELAGRIGLSQARLSEIERGSGSFSAEQLIAVLGLFNVSIAEFLPRADLEHELQNALIEFGARHLRQVPGVIARDRFQDPAELIAAVLIDPRSARSVAALGPVLLEQIDTISLPALHARLAAVSRGPRLGWLLENVRDALQHLAPKCAPAWRRKAARAITLIDNELARFTPAALTESPPDVFDATIRSARTLKQVWQDASDLARRWHIATELRPEDFQQALWQAHESD